MKRSIDRILTTHTGSLPRTAKVVELLLAEQAEPGQRRAELQSAVAEAVAGVVRNQVECGLDIINDGEQGRTDYTVHVMDRLTGYEGESAPPMGTGDEEFPELAALLKQFASPFQHRPACNGPVDWRDWPAAQADIDRAKSATTLAATGGKSKKSNNLAEETFMTSPSPGQIARYLKNKYYPTEEAYVYALADVMRREYTAIVEAGFMLQLDCPDLAMLRHMVYLDKSLADFRKIIAVNVAALNHAVRDLPPDRMRMHVCWGSTLAPHHTDVELKDIIDIVLSARPQAVSFPGANPRHEHEWKIWRERETAARQDHHSGRDRFDLEFRRAPGTGGRPHRELRQRGRARERHRRRRLRLRHLCRPRAGRQQDRLAEAAIAGRGRTPGVEAFVEAGGANAPTPQTTSPASRPKSSAACPSSGVQSINKSSRCPSSGITSAAIEGCGQSVPHISRSGLAATSASCSGRASA